MILALVVLVALATTHLVMLWKAFMERSAKWELYAIRDELRWAGINDGTVLRSPLFTRVDKTLTAMAGNLHEISLWPMLPLLPYWRSGQSAEKEHEIAILLSRPENAPIGKVIREATVVLARHLACRHMFLTALAFFSIVGYYVGKDFVPWLSRSIVTAVIEPPVPRPAVVGSVLTGHTRVA